MDNQLYKIDDDVPIPEIVRRSKKVSRLTATLLALKPRKSFFIPNVEVKRISPDIAKAQRTLGHVSFTSRTVVESGIKGVRVWRDARYQENKRQRKGA